MKNVIFSIFILCGLYSCDSGYECNNGCDPVETGATFKTLRDCENYCSSNTTNSGSSSGSNNGSSNTNNSGSSNNDISVSISSATYYFPDINNCYVPSKNDNGSRAYVTGFYDLNNGSGAINMNNVEVEIRSKFSGENQWYTNTKGLEELDANNFVFSLCYYFFDNNSVSVQFKLISNGVAVSDTEYITILRPSGGN